MEIYDEKCAKIYRIPWANWRKFFSLKLLIILTSSNSIRRIVFVMRCGTKIFDVSQSVTDEKYSPVFKTKEWKKKSKHHWSLYLVETANYYQFCNKKNIIFDGEMKSLRHSIHLANFQTLVDFGIISLCMW